MQIEAKFYDGVSSKEHNVVIEFTKDKRCIIASHNINLPLSDIIIKNRLANTPRIIELSNGARCKVEDNDKLDVILKELDIKQSSIHKIERSWKLAIGSIVLIALFIVFMLTAGANYSAALIANIMPKGTLDSISKTTFNQLDKRYLHKSNLTKEKKEKILKLFTKLTKGEKRYKLHFRSSPLMGANAFALPNGDVVLLDELVFLDKDKELKGILGVLAHEKAHVVYRHALKGAIKGTIATAVISYITGDVSFIASTLPTLLVTTKYTREFEKEADIYAKDELHKIGISSKPLGKLFATLEHYRPKKTKDKTKDKFTIPEWASTHPATKDRIEFFMQD